jgi:hypothetical protein
MKHSTYRKLKEMGEDIQREVNKLKNERAYRYQHLPTRLIAKMDRAIILLEEITSTLLFVKETDEIDCIEQSPKGEKPWPLKEY